MGGSLTENNTGAVATLYEAAFAELSTSPLVDRAISDSPSGGYAPADVSCPADRPTIRKAGSLSVNETQWLEKRRQTTVDSMRDFLVRMEIPKFDAAGYITGHENNVTALPNYGVAFSGGGWRALMNGA